MAMLNHVIVEQNLVLFFLVLTRLSFVVMAMPAVGVGVPRRIKVLFVLALTSLLLPFLGSIIVPDVDGLPDLAVGLGREAAVGALIGLVIQLLVTGMQLAGELISSTGGLQLGAGVDPQSKAPMPVLGSLVGMLVAAVFIGVGGHHMMLIALVDSFKSIPPAEFRMDIGWIELIAFELSQGVVAGIRAGSPVVAALLLSNLVTGLLSRTMPQINILAIGLNINAIALMTISAVVLGSAGFIFETELSLAIARLSSLISVIE